MTVAKKIRERKVRDAVIQLKRRIFILANFDENHRVWGLFDKATDEIVQSLDVAEQCSGMRLLMAFVAAA